MTIEQLEALVRAGLGKPHDAAILAIIEKVRAQDAELASRKRMLDMVINSVAAALERAGVTSVDDPGEAIDVLVAEKDQKIAQLHEALEGVVRVADRKTVEFDAARAALSKTGKNNGR